MDIEKGIPQKSYKYPFPDMGKGDSFLVPAYGNIESIRVSAIYHGKKLGMKFSVRKTREGHRVWRVE